MYVFYFIFISSLCPFFHSSSFPPHYFTDEATSALDSESEAVVQDAIDTLITDSDMTVVMIAHRLHTVRNANMIAVVDDGRVVEKGTHDSLLAHGGVYAKLFRASGSSVNE